MRHSLEITYLLNSGFLVKTGRVLLVFDDYADPAHAVDKAVDEADFDAFYIFVSHAHFDHFDTHIHAYADVVTHSVFSEDVLHTKRARLFPAGKVAYMKRYAEWGDGRVRVSSFDSTDVGTCFLVEAEGARIFHAGDFNWWHWTGESRESQLLARNAFQKQMKKLEGMEADVAFFPVDGRMGEAWDMGAREFCARTSTSALVTMHNVGFPAWKPGEGFFAEGREIPCWTPMNAGEKRVLEGGSFRE